MKLFLNRKRLSVIVYDGALKQAIGLRFKKAERNKAYLFPIKFPLISVIDTFFVRSDLDIYFMDNKFRVICSRKKVRPFRVVMPAKNTRFILEMLPGCRIKIGKRLKIA